MVWHRVLRAFFFLPVPVKWYTYSSNEQGRGESHGSTVIPPFYSTSNVIEFCAEGVLSDSDGNRELLSKSSYIHNVILILHLF